MGVVLFEINGFFAFIQRFVPRLLTGFLVGFLNRVFRRAGLRSVSFFLSGFFAAFLNTALFMLALVFLFGNTPYVQGLIGGRNIIIFICAFVGINAVVEMAASTFITGIICRALEKARLIGGQL